MKKIFSAVLTGGAVSALLIVGTPAFAASTDDAYDSAKSDSKPVDGRPVSTGNVELVSNLSDLDKCLFSRSVYPAGGVGYADSSLPYDDLDLTTAAALTLRAEAIRDNPDLVLGVTGDGGEPVTRLTIIVDAKAAGNVPISISDIVRDDDKAKAAYDSLSAAGVDVHLDIRDVMSTSRLCDVSAAFHTLADSEGNPVTVFTAPDLKLGGLYVEATKKDEAQVRELASKFGDQVVVEITEISDASRLSDDAPWWGGNRVNDNCSTSFRVNGNSLLTADHCPGASFTNAGSWVGNRYLTLKAANVDALIMAGSSYAGRVYTGGVSSSTSLAANGIYPYYTLGTANQLLVSGSFSGQGTVQYVGVLGGGAAENGCITTDWGYACQLLQTTAPGGVCISGDSGGPAGVYDPANGRMIPTGVIKATTGSQSSTHGCLITNMMAISYLWGNATIG